MRKLSVVAAVAVAAGLALSAQAASAQGCTPANRFGFEENSGKVTRLYPDGAGLYLRVGGPGARNCMAPTNEYYYIAKTNPNYAALYDLVYLAAERGWKLKIRTQPTLGTGGRADVIYLVVDL